MTRRIFVAAAILVAAASPAAAAIDLGAAAPFAVFAGAAVTSTGATAITGSVGVGLAGAITGFSAATVSGALDAGGPAAAAAEADLARAYAAAAAMPGAVALTGQDLGGMVLTPGVYGFAASAKLTGTLRLDAQGDPDAAFVFQIGSTLTTAADAAVIVGGGGSAANVFFQVGSSATIGAGTQFAGSILALASITLGSGADFIAGRALALNGAVTLIDDAIAVPVAPVRFAPVTARSAAVVPEPGTWLLLLAGFGIVGAAQRRARSLPLRFA